MRNLIMLSSVLTLAACGLSEAKFEEKFADKYCEELAACSPETACEDGTGSGTEMDMSECEYDKASAKECLDGTWECVEIIEGLSLPVPPEACGKVYTCSGATTSETTPTTGT